MTWKKMLLHLVDAVLNVVLSVFRTKHSDDLNK